MNSEPFQGFTIVRLAEANPAKVCQLLEAALSNEGIVRKTVDYWHWKHLAGYFGPSEGLVALDPSGSPICCRPLMTWQLLFGDGGAISAARPVDTATRSDWRGRGIFSLLTKESLRLLGSASKKVLFNTPNRSSLPGYLKMGWTVRAEFGFFLLNVVGLRGDRLWRRSDHSSIRISDFSIHENSVEFDQALARCASLIRGSSGQGLRTEKSADYLKWRYKDHPNAQYRLRVGVAEDGCPVVCIVYRRARIRGLPVIYASELAGSRREDVRRLLRSFSLRELGLGLVYGSVIETATPKLPGQYGGVLLKRTPIVARLLGDDDGGPTVSLDAWHLTLGDVETF